MDVLMYLATHTRGVVPKEELLNTVWGGALVEEGVLTQAIHSLRKLLGDDIHRPRYIQTLPKRGYRLIAPVTLAEQSDDAIIAREEIRARGSGTGPLSDQKIPGNGGFFIPALHQLPATPADFTGREEELAAILSLFAEATAGKTIFGLFGMGGVGKTTLALKLAEDLIRQYPDAQLYLDLKGVHPRPLKATQAMIHIISSWYPDVRLPDSETGLAALYRSVLHGKRALLLMDNAANREQVEPLIPPAGSLLLVTSRFRFPLPGLVYRDLREMPDADAEALLLAISPRIGHEAHEIARLCGRLPLALRLAGSAIAERPDLSPSEYVHLLKHGKEQLGEVNASLDLSYELLNAERRKLWRMLAVFPGAFDARAAAAVWGLDLDLSRGALGELVRSSLIAWIDKRQRYQLHDLARGFAAQCQSTEELDLTQRRHAKHFLEVLEEANQLYRSGGDSASSGLRLFDDEWINIQAGHSWAEEHYSVDSDAVKLCNEYPLYGAFILSFRQHPLRWKRWVESAIDAARRQSDISSEAKHVSNLGIVYDALGDLRHAVEQFEQGLSMARKISNRKMESIILGNMSLVYAELGDPERGVELSSQRIAIAREIGDRRGESSALGSMGRAYIQLGDFERARDLFEQQLAIAHEIGNRQGEGYALGSLGLAYRSLGNATHALELHERQLTIAREIGFRREEGYALGELANCFRDLGDFRRAIELYEQYLGITHELSDRSGQATCSWNLGLVYERLGKLEQAIELMQNLVSYRREIGHREAERDAGYVESLRARIAAQKS